MQIFELKGTGSPVSSNPIKPDVLLNRINQLGSIQAQVLSISKGQAILSSPLGRILAANALDLNVGDRLIMRVDSNSTAPKLIVSRPLSESITLDASTHKPLAKLVSSDKPSVAVVSSQLPAATRLRLANQTIVIQPQSNLPVGQLISLQKNPKDNSIELIPLNHQQLLKSAIRTLIPQSVKSQNSATTGVVALLRSLMSVGGRQIPSTHSVNRASQPSGEQKLASGLPASKPPSLLDTLIKAAPKLTELSRSTIERWFNYSLDFDRPRSNRQTTMPAPFQILARLAESETEAYQQIKQFIAASKIDPGSKENPAAPKNFNEEALHTIGRELHRLAEQSISQQLLQQTNLRLQQELQQPLAINISIPVTDNDIIAELRLKIKQRNSESEAEIQAWDIDFDFEFGEMGFISTHLLLKEQTLSASFWSMKPETQRQIEDNLQDFQQQIVNAGLTPGEFHSFHGKPRDSDTGNPMQLADSLLDIRV